MKPRTRLGLEALEDRWCPALTASLQSGLLTISGTADNGSISVVQDSATAGTISVLDGTTAVGSSPFTGVTSVRLNLTSADDNVTIDLGGQALSGSVVANLGAGANSLTVSNGTITGNLLITGDTSASRGCGGRGDGGSAVADTGVDTLTLAAGATVNNLAIRGGAGGSTIDVSGDVTGSVFVDAFHRGGSAAGTSLSVSGTVDGNVLFAGSDQADTLDITGSVGRGVAAALFGGDDKVSLAEIGRAHV